jgi:hypothetical protein
MEWVRKNTRRAADMIGNLVAKVETECRAEAVICMPPRS